MKAKCSFCGDLLILADIVNCQPFWYLIVFNKPEFVCKHCYSRLKMFDDTNPFQTVLELKKEIEEKKDA